MRWRVVHSLFLRICRELKGKSVEVKLKSLQRELAEILPKY